MNISHDDNNGNGDQPQPYISLKYLKSDSCHMHDDQKQNARSNACMSDTDSSRNFMNLIMYTIWYLAVLKMLDEFLFIKAKYTFASGALLAISSRQVGRFGS